MIARTQDRVDHVTRTLYEDIVQPVVAAMIGDPTRPWPAYELLSAASPVLWAQLRAIAAWHIAELDTLVGAGPVVCPNCDSHQVEPTRRRYRCTRCSICFEVENDSTDRFDDVHRCVGVCTHGELVSKLESTVRGEGRSWTADDDARLRELRAAGQRRAEIAAALGRTVPAVGGRLQKLGLIKPKPPAWTPEDDARLLDLLDNHTPYDRIAQQLGRSRNAIIIRIKRKGYDRLRTANGWTLSKVARVILGSRDCQKTVARWVRKRWLRAVWSGTYSPGGHRRPAKVHVVEHDDLIRFLEDERYWHLWEPERIADVDLREWALEMRAGKRYLTTRQVGERLGYTDSWVNECIRCGWLRAVKHGPNWLVREDWLPARGALSDRWTCIVRCAICGAEVARRDGISTNDKRYHAGDVVGDLLGVACHQWAHNAMHYGTIYRLEWVEERHQVGRVNRRPKQRGKVVRLPAATMARELEAVGATR